MHISRKVRNDLLLIAVLLLLAAGGLLALRLFQKTGSTLTVTQNGVQIASYPLDEDGSFTFTDADGGTNLLVIADGKASVTDANCPDQLCVNQHEISANGQTIVCLPHKLVFQVESETEPEVDVYT
jgi:hypothetical protein